MSKIKLSDHFTAGRLFRFVLPSVAMMVFISIYGVVDGFFVSNFAGKTSFASINLIMPFVMILGGVGFMVGTGGTALVSQKLGEGDEKTAKRYFTMMIMLTVILGAVLTTFGLIFTEKVAVFFGATPEMLGDCVLYGRIVISFTTAFMLQNVFQSFFIAAEKPKLGLISTIMAGCTNIILDAVFVGLMDFGVAGAAFATGISECVGGIFPLIYFLRPNSSILILPLIFGVDGIWMANVVAEFFAFLLSLMFLIIKRKKYGYWQKNVALSVEPESAMTNKNAD